MFSNISEAVVLSEISQVKWHRFSVQYVKSVFVNGRATQLGLPFSDLASILA